MGDSPGEKPNTPRNARKSAPSQVAPPSSPGLGKVILLVMAWIIPAAWVAMAPPFQPAYRPTAETKKRLKDINDVIHRYIKQYDKPPADLSLLRAFARSEGLPFEAYDAHGERFEYMRLDGSHYLVRSFGSDGQQNSVTTAADTGIVRWGQRSKKDYSYAFPAPNTSLATLAGFYPAALAAASESPGGQWLARIYADPDSGQRSLVVRHKSKPGLFLAARHDRVEEFLWLPHGDALVFSATGSSRHRDGLYLWNLQTDAQTNLFDDATQTMPISPANRGGRLWVTLSAVTAGPEPVIFAYAAPRHDGPLDPAWFFDGPNLVVMAVDRRGHPRFLEEEELLSLDYQTPILRPYQPAAFVQAPQAEARGLPTQRAWTALTTTGALEPVLLKWHSFSETQTRSPLYSYCLWVLSTLYGEAYAKLSNAGHTDADVLRTFGTEIARALIEQESAPTYLRSLALHNYELLMEGEKLPYAIAQLSISGESGGEPTGTSPTPLKGNAPTPPKGIAPTPPTAPSKDTGQTPAKGSVQGGATATGPAKTGNRTTP